MARSAVLHATGAMRAIFISLAEWLPYLYHGACAWTGAHRPRLFPESLRPVLYGLKNDAAIRAMESASGVNAKTIRVRDKDGNATDVSTTYI